MPSVDGLEFSEESALSAKWNVAVAARAPRYDSVAPSDTKVRKFMGLVPGLQCTRSTHDGNGSLEWKMLELWRRLARSFRCLTRVDYVVGDRNFT